MFPIPSQTLRSTPLVKRFRLVLPIVLALVAATSIAACGDDSGNLSQPTPSNSTGVTPSGTAEATPSGATEAAPLGEGELIVFERVVPGAEARELYLVEPDGGEPRLLRSAGDYPHWSPDGSQLVFLACLNPPDCTTAFARMDRSTGDVRGFSMPDPELFTPCLIWTPSGTELACAALSDIDSTRNGVYTLRASDGQGLTRITKNPGGEDFPLAYSPDGNQLLINREDPSRAESANHALFIAPVSGRRPHRITPWGYADDVAGWSRDGRTIVFGTNGSLYQVSPDGHGLAEITVDMPDGSSAETAFDVGVAPDGGSIIFSLGSPSPGIYIARADGSGVKRVTSGEDHHASWIAASGP